MNEVTILDTGPLVAFLDRTEVEHARTVKLMAGLAAPFVTAEPVLTEACHLLRRIPGGAPTVMRLVRDGLVSVGLSVGAEAEALEALMRKYADVPMSLADACLVRLVERHRRARVLTFDSDFQVYRAKGSQRIAVLGPRGSS